MSDDFRPIGALYWGVSREGWIPPTSLTDEDAKDVKSALAVVNNSLAPAPTDEIERILTDLMFTTHHEEASEEVWKHRFRLFKIDLGHFPADILADAAEQYRREQRFYPVAVVDFLEYVNPLYKERLRTKRRLEVLVNVSDSPAPDNKTITKEWLDMVEGTRVSISGGMNRLDSLVGNIVKENKEDK